MGAAQHSRRKAHSPQLPWRGTWLGPIHPCEICRRSDSQPPLPTLPHAARASQSNRYTTGIVGLWHVGLPESDAGKKLSRQVREALPAKWTVAAGGKVKRAVLDEYAAVQVLLPLPHPPVRGSHPSSPHSASFA